MKQGFPFKLYRKCVSVCFVGISDHSTHITTPLDLRPICRIGQLEVLDGDEDIGRGFRPDLTDQSADIGATFDRHVDGYVFEIGCRL